MELHARDVSEANNNNKIDDHHQVFIYSAVIQLKMKIIIVLFYFRMKRSTKV